MFWFYYLMGHGAKPELLRLFVGEGPHYGAPLFADPNREIALYAWPGHTTGE